MKIISRVELTHNQEVLIKRIANMQIRSLLHVSSDPTLLTRLGSEYKPIIVSQLLRDFSRLSESPKELFNSASDTQSIFRHELFNMDTRSFNAHEISGLWKKLFITNDITQIQLN